MIRFRRLLALALLASGTAPVQADTPACQSHAPRHDRLDVRCSWPPAAATGEVRALRFEARFAGSHDDTTASLSASLDGRPLVCAAGSKTEIDGQDEGDVTLSCRVSVAAAAGAAPVLRFQLAWYHARYASFDLQAE
jgi:hypothetical protein